MPPSLLAMVVSPSVPTREAIARALVRLGLRPAGEAATPADAVETAGDVQPDLVVIGHRLTQVSEVLSCREIREVAPKARLVCLTWYAHERDYLLSLLAGASACLLVQARSVNDLTDVVARVVRGENLIREDRAAQLAAILNPAITPISADLRAVAAAAFQLQTDSEIARELAMDAAQVREAVGGIIQAVSPMR